MHFRWSEETKASGSPQIRRFTLEGYFATPSPQSDAVAWLGAIALPTVEPDKEAGDAGMNADREDAGGSIVHPMIQLDCRGITGVCSSGIGWLLEVRRILLQRHYRLSVVHATSVLQDALEVLEISSVMSGRKAAV